MGQLQLAAMKDTAGERSFRTEFRVLPQFLQEVFAPRLVVGEGYSQAFDRPPVFIFQFLVDEKTHLVLRHDSLHSGRSMRFSMHALSDDVCCIDQ